MINPLMWSILYVTNKFTGNTRKTMFTAIILAIALVVGVVAHEVTKQNDHPVEQIAESILKSHGGIDIDFSAEDKQEEAEDK